ncbi:MAG: Lrp/AsnC family transcriptional regulator [Methanobacteriota archaeon]|nr:MAG: Lrp/AsnC family transcriptional regulator [Euryarchaeota archaeon]
MVVKLLDELDVAILRRLNTDARKSFRDIARELRVSISTVSNRVKRLEHEGIVLGYIPVLDEKKLGYDVLAVIGIRISKGKLLEVQRKIGREDKVVDVYDVTGEYDSVIIARFRNTKELDTFIKRLVAMENVERTYTQVVLNVVKQEKRAPI